MDGDDGDWNSGATCISETDERVDNIAGLGNGSFFGRDIHGCFSHNVELKIKYVFQDATEVVDISTVIKVIQLFNMF